MCVCSCRTLYVGWHTACRAGCDCACQLFNERVLIAFLVRTGVHPSVFAGPTAGWVCLLLFCLVQVQVAVHVIDGAGANTCMRINLEHVCSGRGESTVRIVSLMVTEMRGR